MSLIVFIMHAIAQEKMNDTPPMWSTVQMSKACDLGGYNQGILPVNSAASPIQFEWWESAGFSDSYDRQCQGSMYSVTQIHSDVFIEATWTNENQENPSFSGGTVWVKRGVAYVCPTDGGKTWSKQESRMGGIPVYWSSCAQWGPHDEAVLARVGYSFNHEGIDIKDGLVLFTRENKGVEEWDITPISYPEGISPADGYVTAWERMTTSRDNHQYIHIMSPMDCYSAVPHDGTDFPVYYFSTQNGRSWNVEGKLVTEMIGEKWTADYVFNDNIDFAVQGDIVAVSFIAHGNHGYILKPQDNGDNWECIIFFDFPILGCLTSTDYTDTVYIPVQGFIALDYNEKVHIVFALTMSLNTEQVGFAGYFSGLIASFLSYWNEDMPMMNGDTDYKLDKVKEMILTEYLDDTLSNSAENKYYRMSTIPKLPVIGLYTPLKKEHYVTIDNNIMMDWEGSNYRAVGGFLFPQMAFDADNVSHLVYLGFLDGGSLSAGHWHCHLFYTTTADGGQTWTQTEYLINNVDLIDQEFAYPALAGINNDKMYLTQIDPHPGIYTTYNEVLADHSQAMNYYHFLGINGLSSFVSETEYAPMLMSVVPNPASGQITVTFEGKGNVTVYNMLGQEVYCVENVENTKQISLNNMTTGVYFVTICSGNNAITKKLIVK